MGVVHFNIINRQGKIRAREGALAMAIALMAHSDKDGRRRSTVPRRRNSFGTDWRYVLLFAALLIPFFEPTGFIRGVVPEVAGLFKVWRVATVAALVCLCIRHGSKDAFSLIAIAITALMFLSTLINEGAGRTWIYVQCFYDWAPLLVSVLLVNYAYRDRMTELLWAILIVTGVLSICNTISVLGWPQGVVTGTREPSNFYGHKNASIDLALPSVGCSLLLDAQRGRRCSARSVALFAIGLVQCIVSYSATSVVALALFPVLFVAVQFRKTRPAVNGFSCFGAYVVAAVLLMGVKIQELFAPIIVGVLGKTVTFTLRTFVWDGIFSLMTPDHLLLGYGASVRFGLFFNDFLYNNAHNFFLHVLVSGGLAGVVLYGILILLAMRTLYQGRHDFASAVLTVVVACFFVIGLMESLITISWPLMLALAYYWDAGRTSAIRV